MQRYGVGVLVVALLVGCTRAGDDRPAPTLREAWRLNSFTPIGQPVAVGDMVVAYGTVERDLLVFGISVADGTIRWRQPASPSIVASGIPVTPDVIDGRVAYFRPDRFANLGARLVVAAPDTGADLLVSEPLHFTSYPGSCADGKDVCVRVVQGDRSVSRRFSVDAGGAVGDAGAPPADSRFIGTNLLELGQRQPEMLAGFEGGAVRWRSPLAKHFPAGHSTDEGWHFELYRAAGVHVGSVGSHADGDATKGGVDLSKAHTAAIRAGDGSPAWRAEATNFLCYAKFKLQHKVADGWEHWPVRCRMRGILHYDGATEAFTHDGLDVTVEGFDVGTGATTWSVPLGAASTFMDEHTKAIGVSETEALVQRSTSPVIIDLSNGATRPPAQGESFWCGKDTYFQYREAKQFRDGSTSDRWRSGTVVYPCAGEGSTGAAVPRYIPPSLGAKVGDRTVLGLADGIVAYDPPIPAPA